MIKELQKRKQLGQFFTGKKLSNLLAAFVSEEKFLSVLDPMCGTGDLLKAAGEINKSASLVGIDIDEEVTSTMSKNSSEFPSDLKVYTGNVFSKTLISKLPKTEYDLVIANPPYVRYQSFSDVRDDSTISAMEIRKELIRIVSSLNHLDEKDKDIFIEVIKGYSGLADLAVPSWILSAMLTKVGGKLAIIVPESWLNRDYAFSIQYLLLKFFNIEYVVEDFDRAWFKDNAQVKTNLIIAKRIPRVESLTDYYRDKNYLHVGISSDYEDRKSIVGKLYPDSEKPDIELFKGIKSSEINTVDKKLSINNLSFSAKLDTIYMNVKEKAWFKLVEREYKQNSKSIVMPSSVRNIISSNEHYFDSLAELGIKTGQGLRTGANKFFYVDYISGSDDSSLILPNKEIFNKPITVPNEALKVVLRKQAELPSNYLIKETDLKGRVLILKNYISLRDRDKLVYKTSSRKLMPQGLSSYVTKAEITNLGDEKTSKFFPDLSAVKPNVRSMKEGNLDTANFWYMLPELTPRHLPEIFVARINGKAPKFYMNSNLKVVIDANFSTFCIEPSSPFTKTSLLAFLNSDWVILCCELLGSVMGGGALKLEATHLKKIPVPHFSSEELQFLDEIGKGVIEGTRELDEVNNLIAKNIFQEDFKEGQRKIHNLLVDKSSHRIKER